MRSVGYLPYAGATGSTEAGWLAERLGVDVRVVADPVLLNEAPVRPDVDRLDATVRALLPASAVVAEGPAGLLWAAALRARGFGGDLAILPYLNPRRWYDVAAAAVYRRFARAGDRVFLGSTPSAAIWRGRGIAASVAEPYGIDDRVFRPRAEAERVRSELGIGPGRVLLFAGRAQVDKDIYTVLRVGLKARLLFGDLRVVLASHVVDRGYMAAAHARLGEDDGVHFVADPTPARLAALYTLADVFVTAATSGFETFGRAPAQALACGAPVVAPRYDGLAEVLDQPGGYLVEVATDPDTGAPHVPEDRLLRAVYDALSHPDPPSRGQVAAVARRRFGRSTTLAVLDYLAGSAPPPPVTAIAPAVVELPPAWRGPLDEIAARDPAAALAWFWDCRDHERLAAHDGEFALGVRRALCPAPPGREVVGACR